MRDSPSAAPDAETPVPYRGGGFRIASNRWAGPLVFIALIAFIEIGLRLGWIGRLTLPLPSEVLETFQQLWVTGALWDHLLPSLSRFAVGGTLGAIAGIGVGTLIGLFGLVRAGLVPVVAALFPVPKIALLPLFVIWFGIGEG